jgi:hypothetical protein
MGELELEPQALPAGALAIASITLGERTHELEGMDDPANWTASGTIGDGGPDWPDGVFWYPAGGLPAWSETAGGLEPATLEREHPYELRLRIIAHGGLSGHGLYVRVIESVGQLSLAESYLVFTASNDWQIATPFTLPIDAASTTVYIQLYSTTADWPVGMWLLLDSIAIVDGAGYGELPLANVIADVTIRHGRAGYFESGTPSTCSIALLGATHDQTHRLRLGEPLIVNASDGATIAPRFTGRLTDATLELDRLTLTAVGFLRTLGGYTIPGDYAAEVWSDRVWRAFNDAGLAAALVLEVGAFNPMLVARPASPITLADYLDELAGMVNAAVADLPDGRILVQTSDSRSLEGGYALHPAEVAYAPTWLEVLPDANIVTVTYGDPAAPSSVTARDQASIDLYGPIESSVSTTFYDAADANAVATARIARDAYAHWFIADAPLLYGRRLLIGQPLELSSLPASAPHDPWNPILEGWTDTIVSDGLELAWTMQLSLSDPTLSGLALPWNQVPAGTAWNELDPALAWRDALTLDDFTP